MPPARSATAAELPSRVGRAIAIAVLLASAAPFVAGAQGLIDRAKQKIQDRVNNAEDSLTDAALDKATGAITCAATNTQCIHKALGAGKTVKVVDKNGKPVSAADSAKAVNAAGGVPATAQNASATSSGSAATTASAPAFDDAVLVNYDFVPGDRVIFAEDFSKDNIGDFPKRLELRRGNFEVAKWQGQQFLRTNSGGVVTIPLPEVLPQRFTFEADYHGSNGWSLEVNFADPDAVDNLVTASFSPGSGQLAGGGVNSSSDLPDAAVKPIGHVAVMADGKYVKTYVNGVRVSNVPSANIGRGKVIVVSVPGNDDEPGYLSNIRVAAGGKPLYDAIMADGRVATHGILFDTGSDRIRGESKPTLDMIGQMLKDHADLKLTIEGHTDNVGSAVSNQTLSDKRAAAVRQFLIATYHVDAGRLASKGLGSAKPAASNDTPEGRQQNRRVELVKN
jgi:outer membrane protein OmpA-like peptidoglycan-associated protein